LTRSQKRRLFIIIILFIIILILFIIIINIENQFNQNIKARYW